MHKKLLPEAEQYAKQNHRRRIWRKFVRFMACIVVFCTTYALILPAITMEKKCELEEHTHSESCYSKITAEQVTELTCTYEFLGVHVHTQNCYDGENHPICGYADYLVHEHDASCADETGTILCVLPEVEEHEHSDDCYQAVETEPASTEAGEGTQVHTHDDTCYSVEQGELTCQIHTHNDGCYTQGTLACDQEETDGHTHSTGCSERVLSCDLAVEPHVHDDAACYQQLVCELPEDETHTHSDACNGRVLNCDLTEQAHTHTDTCYQTNSLCDLPEQEGHSHTEECYESVLGCGEEAAEDHQHTADCYAQVKTLICQQEEDVPAADTEAAETTPATEPELELICDKEIIKLHSHSDSCYEIYTDETGAEQLELICRELVVLEHTHSDTCFTISEIPLEDTDSLTCGFVETEIHTHSESCYDESEVQICTEQTQAHTHSELCYGTWELICAMEEHIHDEICTPPEIQYVETTATALIYTDGSYEILSEDATVITVSGLLPEGAEIRAYPVTVDLEQEVICAYEIAIFLPDGTIFEPEDGESLTVQFQLPEVPQSDLEVYYVPDEGHPEAMGADQTDEGVTFEAPHFSTYAVTTNVEASATTSSVVTNADGNIEIFVQNENYYTADEIILIDCYLLEEYCNPNYYEGNPLPFGDYTGYNGDGTKRTWSMNEEALSSFRNQTLSFEDYTALIIEYLNPAQTESGKPEYYVEAVIKGGVQMNPGQTMLNLVPDTDFGYVLYIPNSLLTETTTPNRGDLVASNFWHGQEETEHKDSDGNSYWKGDGVRLGWNQGLGTLIFTDNPASSTVLETATPTTVNATVKMFDYGRNMNSLHPDEYLFWNGDYGYGADIESVDGWGVDFILVNGEYVGAWPFDDGKQTIAMDAYHGYNRFPTMVPTLSTDGYPQFSDKTPSNKGQSVELDYLFDGTYQTGSTLSGGGGLFQQDGDGYYYYDSLQNAAYFNGSEFVLYDDLIVRPWADSKDSSAQAYGNFLPLNPITTDNITLDGYVYSEDRSTVSKATGWTGALTVEGQSEASATKTLEQDGNNRLKQSVYDLGLYTARLENKSNLWFGMTVEFEFYQPANGQVDNVLTEAVDLKDMIFDFHGDDDVLVYVGVWNDETQAYDYKLTLDLSGVHEARSGNINFATGAVYYQKHNHDTGTSTESIPGTGKVDVNTSLKEIFGLDGNTFTDYTKLAIKFFYLERGGNISYCRLRFNMPTLPEKSLMVTKELQYDSGDEELKDYIADAYDYQFRVMKANASGGATSTVLIPEGATYSILENGAVVGTGTVGEDGIFTLKAGQSALFKNLLETYGNVNYVVQELITTEIEGQYENVWYSVNGGTNTETNKDTSTSHDFTSFDTGKLSTSQSENVVYRNKVDVQKLSSLRITKAAAEGATFAEGTKFQIQVTLGGEPLPVGAEYTVGEETRTVSTAGIIELAVGETALINGILSGTEYTVREVEGSYTTTYTGQTSGALGIGEVIKITVTNADYATHVTLPVQKTYLGNSGNATFTFGVEQVDAQGGVIAQLEGTSITVTGADAASGNIHIKFSKGVKDGTYYYRVFEKSGSLNAIYDDTIYQVAVQVSNGKASILSVDGTSYNGSTLSFVNRKLTNVAITKTVTGNVSPQGLKFSFTATVLYNGEIYSPATNSAYTVNEDGTVTFELEADETVTIRGIPVGAQITVTETVRDGFEPSYTVGGTVTEGDTVTLTVAESANSIVCNNEGTYLLPQTGGTGITTYTMAGMMLMLFSAAYLLYRFSKRRREAV